MTWPPKQSVLRCGDGDREIAEGKFSCRKRLSSPHRFSVVTGRDVISALDHPYRQDILRVLYKGRTAYSDLFNHLEPNGGERGRFNYHLRSLRNADLVQLEDSQYRLTERGKAALILLRGVSDHPEFNPGAREKSPKRDAGRTLGARSISRIRAGFASLRGPDGKASFDAHAPLAQVGAYILLMSTFLPWVYAGDYGGWDMGGGHWLPGLFIGIGGALTLAFALAALVAMRVPRRTATALAGVLGVLAVSSTLLTWLAMTHGIAPALIGGLRSIHGGLPLDYTIPFFGVHLSLGGALMLVLGTGWTLLRGRGTVAASAGSDTDPTETVKTPPDEVDRSLQGGTTLRMVAHPN